MSLLVPPFLVLASGACVWSPEPPSQRALEDALLRHDDAGVLAALPGRKGLARWLERQVPPTALDLSGTRFRVGGVSGVLGARLNAAPGRWEGDRWPLGALVFADRIVDVRRDGPTRLSGTVRFDRATATLQGELTVEGAAPHGVLVFHLGEGSARTNLQLALQDGAPVPWHTDGSTWVVAARGDRPLQLRYRVQVPNDDHDLLLPDVVLLTRDGWLPTPLANEVDTALDLRLTGLADLELRGGSGLSRDGADWRLVGSGLEHELVTARPSWTLTRTDIEGIGVEVATTPGGRTDGSKVAERAADAIRALHHLGTLPRTIRISEIPRDRAGGDKRAPHASLGGHVTLPEGYVRSNPLGLAHEVVHLLLGPHRHPPAGLPTVEEPVAEFLSQRAARTPEEARNLRRSWQHRVEVREGGDGRPLLDAYRLYSVQYSRGALLLEALEGRIGEDTVLDLLFPLDERATGTWHDLADAVYARDAVTGAWLRTMLEAPTLPAPEVRLAESGTGFLVVDAGDTGLPVDLDVQVVGLDSGVLELHHVRLDRPEVLPLPDGAISVQLDPGATAIVRVRRDDARWDVPRPESPSRPPQRAPADEPTD
jgi:hypothetical protein